MTSCKFWFSASIVSVTLLLCQCGCTVVDDNSQESRSMLSHNGLKEPMLAKFLPEQKRQLQVETANRLFAQGHASEAAKLFLQAEQSDPQSPPFNRQLASLFATLGKFDSSLERYQRAIAASPDDNELQFNYAWTLMDAGNLKLAIEQFSQLIAASPSNKAYLNALEICRSRERIQQGAAQENNPQ